LSANHYAVIGRGQAHGKTNLPILHRD